MKFRLARSCVVMSVFGVLFCGSAVAAPALPGPPFPSFADAAAVQAACDSGLATAEVRVKALEGHAPDDTWLPAWDDLNAYIEDVSGPLDLLVNVHPDKSIRDAAEACTLRWSGFQSTLGQNRGAVPCGPAH